MLWGVGIRSSLRDWNNNKWSLYKAKAARKFTEATSKLEE